MCQVKSAQTALMMLFFSCGVKCLFIDMSHINMYLLATLLLDALVNTRCDLSSLKEFLKSALKSKGINGLCFNKRGAFLSKKAFQLYGMYRKLLSCLLN